MVLKNTINFIDIHTHFLPGIDDGPRTLDETVEMLRMAHAGGTRSVVATPHMFHSSFDLLEASKVEESFARTIEDLRASSAREGNEFLTELDLLPGAENYATPAFMEALEKEDVLTLNRGRYLLVEFDLNFPTGHIVSVADRILAKGLVPILAHVERYRAVRRDPELLRRLLEKGCLTQVNSASFEGSFWSKGRRFAFDLLDKDLVSVIASDSHGAHHRPPQMMETFLKISSRVGPERAEALFHSNPEWVVSAKRSA